MKNAFALILIIPAFLFPLFAQSQKANITEIPVDGNSQTTTIEIKKGDRPSPEGKEIHEILDGHSEVSGDPNPMQKAARESWKKACDEWKKEVKDLNKENQVLILNCNSPKCSIENGSTICKSEATYKVKVKLKK